MADVVKMMEPLKRYLRPATTVIDNIAFRIHYQVTCGIYLLFFIISFARKYFGDPILCHLMTRSGGSMGGLVTIFCWGRGTYTNEDVNTGIDFDTQLDQTHPGVGTFHQDIHKKVYHDYYQWVGLWLVFQLVSFYIIRLVWKMLEGGKMAFLVKGVNELRQKDKRNEDRADMDEYEEDETKEEERLEKLYSSYKYFFCNSSRNTLYAGKYIFCEILLLLHVLLQFHFTDNFLGTNFSRFGLRVFEPEVPGVIGVLDKVFPKVTMCDFERHSLSGDITSKDVMCILPLNIVNEKIFLLLWFWMVILAIISILNLVYRLVVIVTPGLRQSLMFKYTTMNSVNKRHINIICRNGSYGDWFIMKLFMKNIHHDTFVKFLARMAREIKNKEEFQQNTNQEIVSKDEKNVEHETTDDDSFVTVIHNVDRSVKEKYVAPKDLHKASVHSEGQAVEGEMKKDNDKMKNDKINETREKPTGGDWFDPSVLSPVTNSVHFVKTTDDEDEFITKTIDEKDDSINKCIDQENESKLGNFNLKNENADKPMEKETKQSAVKFVPPQ